MSDQEFDEVEAAAPHLNENPSRCPTCGTKLRDIEGEVEPLDRQTYRFLGQTYLCQCQHQDDLRRHYILANIPRKYWRYRPDDWYGDPRAFRKAQEYLEHWPGFKDHGIGLEFYSEGQGTGKTFLATWIARELVKLGETVYYDRFLSLVGLYNNPNRDRIERRVRYATALILDEVGYGSTDAQNAFFAGQFEDLMRSRIDNALPTIITTNMMPDMLDKYYPRTYSLLAGSQIRYEVDSEDVRRKGDILMIGTELAKRGEKAPIS